MPRGQLKKNLRTYFLKFLQIFVDKVRLQRDPLKLTVIYFRISQVYVTFVISTLQYIPQFVETFSLQMNP